MRYSLFALAAAITTVYADYADCEATYNTCIAAGTPMVKCQCDLYTCSGEDPQRIRDYCATATAGLSTASATSAASSSAASAAATCASPVAGNIPQPSGQPQVTACAGSIPIGGVCGADAQCANGAKCYGTTEFTIRTCGSFYAPCDNDSQCSTNTCSGGSCSGFKASSSSMSAPMTTTVTSASSSSTSSCAAPGSNNSNGQYSCNPAHEYPSGQTCVLVDGCFVLTSTSAAGTTMTVSVSATGSMTAAYTTAAGPVNGTTMSTEPTMPASSGTGSAASPSSSTVPYTGSASVAAAISGLFAMVAGVAAFIV